MVDFAAAESAVAPEELALLEPIANVAAHYRWDFGVRAASNIALAPPDGCSFACGLSPAPGVIPAVETPSTLWTTGDALPTAAGHFRYVEIPVEASPEQVLECIAKLRA